MKFRSLLEILSILCLVIYFASCSAGKKAQVTVIPANVENTSDVQLRKSIAQFAQTKLGAKYKYANRGPNQFDCSGFTYFVLKEFDISVPPVSREQEKLGQAINWKDAQAGDLLFYRRSKSEAVFHVSLVIENSGNSLKVIHATSSRGVVIDDIYQSTYWNNKIITARSIL